MSPFLEAIHYNDHLLIVDVVIQLGGRESLAVECKWMPFLVWLVLVEDATFCKVRSVRFDRLRSIWVVVRQDRGLAEASLQFVKSLLALCRPFPQDAVMGQQGERPRDLAESIDEPAIQVCKT